jgi:single-strand DNA-binding protein
MPNFEQTIITGHAGSDAEFKTLQSGQSLCSVSVAVTRKWQSNDEWQESTNWYKVTMWGKGAEDAAKSINKGDVVTAIGRVEAKAWTDSNGNARASLELTAHKLFGIQQQRKPKSDSGSYAPNNQDDIPW